MTRIDYYGTDGAPVLTNAGYTAKTTEYDSRGNAVFESYFGTNGQPLPGSKKIARAGRSINMTPLVLK